FALNSSWVKCQLDSLEGQVYRQIRDELSQPAQAEEIRTQFPKPSIHRRNTGYAVDVLLESEIFTEAGDTFNFCKLLTGSEGTLAFTKSIKIHVDPVPPTYIGLMCPHHETIRESLEAVQIAMSFQPRAVELMDKIVMDCTKGNLMYQKYRFFLQGDPEAVLMIEVGGDSEAEVQAKLDEIETAFKEAGYGYHFPRVFGGDIKKAWALRKAGLGLLANIPGDAKAVAVIEDTAVTIEDLPDYIDEISGIMDKYGQRSVYYAHAGAGEIHLRPILDLKKAKDRQLFWDIGHDTARLVKKYDGSLSGEHGDGRVRAEFIPIMIGEKNYELIKRVKHTWDPQNIFNPGKIVDAPPMNESLRYEADQPTKQFDTVFDFSATDGILRAAEKCNGSGDCRKTHLSGGTMCPSYMATRSEKDTTRARANILREILTRSEEENPFAHEEIYEVMDLCLACKGCASECPSNVNVATLKAEFLHQYHKKHGIPLRSKAFAHIAKLNGLGANFPGLTNFFLQGKLSSGLMKKILKVAPQRSLPALSKQTLSTWYKKQKGRLLVPTDRRKGVLYFFVDEFTEYNDTEIGKTAIELLAHLGYQVNVVKHPESGRAAMSKGLLNLAQKYAKENVAIFHPLISEETPLVGLEPSAILSFRDEYPKLVAPEMQEKATQLGQQALMVDEFLAREMAKGNISPEQFADAEQHILLHGHCHQKALSSVNPTQDILSLPTNYSVEIIPSGCCGMAGSFGYEAEHYEVSMQVGELVLFPKVRAAAQDVLIAAPGTSCRHQIADGAQRKALHPVEILWQAVKR
ncbi:MAG: FAD-linked oxidase C-terminal domain-containing protein, partial [Bacteroidota bacterium]